MLSFQYHIHSSPKENTHTKLDTSLDNYKHVTFIFYTNAVSRVIFSVISPENNGEYFFSLEVIIINKDLFAWAE